MRLSINQRAAQDVLDALENVDAEIEQLELDESWYVSDSREKLQDAMFIMKDLLGYITYEEEPTE